MRTHKRTFYFLNDQRRKMEIDNSFKNKSQGSTT